MVQITHAQATAGDIDEERMTPQKPFPVSGASCVIKGTRRRALSLKESEEHCRDKEYERQKMIPMELLALEQETGNHSEDYQRHSLLNDLQLDKTVWPAIAREAILVGRDHKAILKECYSPRERYDSYQRPRIAYLHLLQTEMTIPGKRHEDI